MTWVAIAAGAAAVIGAGASYAGSKKQGDAAKRGANLQMQQFQTLNQQQQPFIQSGYGAMGRLNTLLGLGGGQSSGVPRGTPSYMPTGNGGMRQNIPYEPQMTSGPKMQPQGQNPRLNQILMLRAQHGDTEAQRVLESMQ